MRKSLAAFLVAALCTAFILSVPAGAENVHTLSWQAVMPSSGAQSIRMEYALTQMREKYPGITIDIAMPGESAAGDMDIIARIDGGGIFLSELYKEGGAADLLAFGPIAEAVADWPDLTGLMGEEGKLFALPQKLLPRLMEVKRPALLAELSAKTDFTGWTWADFFELGDALYEYNAKNGTSYLLAYDDGFTPMWLSQYMENEHFVKDGKAPDVKALESLLIRWKKAVDLQLIRWDSRDVAAEESTLFTFAYERFPYLEGRQFIPIPVYRQGTRATEVSAEYLYVNAASPRLEIALEFMAYYNAAKAFGDQADSAQDIGIVRTGSTAGTKEHRELWRDALENGYLRRVAKGHKDVMDALRAYMEGDVDLAACVKVIAGTAAER